MAFRYVETDDLRPGDVILFSKTRRLVVTSAPVITEGRRTAHIGVSDLDSEQTWDPLPIKRGSSWRCTA